jgi:hypothetical protein
MAEPRGAAGIVGLHPPQPEALRDRRQRAPIAVGPIRCGLRDPRRSPTPPKSGCNSRIWPKRSSGSRAASRTRSDGWPNESWSPARNAPRTGAGPSSPSPTTAAGRSRPPRPSTSPHPPPGHRRAHPCRPRRARKDRRAPHHTCRPHAPVSNERPGADYTSRPSDVASSPPPPAVAPCRRRSGPCPERPSPLPRRSCPSSNGRSTAISYD